MRSPPDCLIIGHLLRCCPPYVLRQRQPDTKNGRLTWTRFAIQRARSCCAAPQRVIPTGIPGNLSPAWYPQADFYPNYATRGSGARFTDADGNEFVDYLCGFGPIILGYSHRKVNEAVHRQIDDGTVMSRATPNSIDLAEELVDMVEIADWAFFCKNGADVTALAVLTAKAATGRKKIVLINGGYHGTAAWMQPADSAGISDEDVENVIWIDWNDVAAFERVIAETPVTLPGSWRPRTGCRCPATTSCPPTAIGRRFGASATARGSR